MADADKNAIVIVGAGIGGLTLALSLHAAGLGDRVRIFEAVPEFKPVGGGINLGPHAVQVFSDLGLEPDLLQVSKQPNDYAFFTRHGQFVYREPWGKAAGHKWPHISIHRGELHNVLWKAVVARIGEQSLKLATRCVSASGDANGVVAKFTSLDGNQALSQSGCVLIGCDGVHSVIRKSLYPNEGPPRYHGINLWRGVAVHKPILTGSSIVRVGAMRSTLIVYPIRENYDGKGNQLVNWVAEVDSEKAVPADWNGIASVDDFLPVYKDWTFDWLDVPALFRSTNPILAYPMVDRDPLDRWTFDRMTLLGDAAHPMFPRGGNGGAQAILDARALARCLAADIDNAPAALQAYEAERRPATTRVVLQNRTAPPNIIVDTVEQRAGGKPFARLEDLVKPEELREIFAAYQKIAGYHVDVVGRTGR